MKKDTILILSEPDYFPKKAVQMAALLAKGFEKEVCFIAFAQNEEGKKQIADTHEAWNKTLSFSASSFISMSYDNQLSITAEQLEASFLIIELSPTSRYRKPQPLLNILRTCRIPYIFVNERTIEIKLNKVMIPVGFLVEEKEKGIFASKMVRSCGSEVVVLQAKDYGSRAARSVEQIETLFAKLSITCSVKKAAKDSFGVQAEAVKRASNGEADFVIITASREYGLDDIIFGPPERKMIATSRVPLMVLNPRPDLYVLCD